MRTTETKQVPKVARLMETLRQPSIEGLFGSRATVAELDEAFDRALRAQEALPPAGPATGLNINRVMSNVVRIGRETLARRDHEIRELQQRRGELAAMMNVEHSTPIERKRSR
jgi:hypothetical protein